MKVVILAGGMGTRISEESHLRPKPMIEIGDRPILWHIMKIYSHCGFNDFIICLGYKGYMIKEFFADYYLHMADITIDFTKNGDVSVHNNVAEPWKVTLVDTGLHTQTGGRIRKIRKHVGNAAFMLTYGDGVSDIDVGKLLEYHNEKKQIATISAVQPGGRYGVLEIDTDCGVTSFREKAVEDGGWINAGFMVLEPGVFEYISDDDMEAFEKRPLENLASDGQLNAYKYEGFWKCMDTQRDKYALEDMWQSGNAPWKVWND